MDKKTCDICNADLELCIDSNISVYYCGSCDTALCEDCLEEEYENNDCESTIDDETIASPIKSCPYCGEPFQELTQEDLETITFEEMFN